MRINKKERDLLKILMLMIVLLILNLFIINPINLKVATLKNEEQDILNLKEKEKIVETLQAKEASKDEEDIILKIEKELKQFINVDHINKTIVWDENNNDETNIEIKISGNLEQVFQVEEAFKNLGRLDDIKKIEVSKAENINNEDESGKVQCIITVREV